MYGSGGPLNLYGDSSPDYTMASYKQDKDQTPDLSRMIISFNHSPKLNHREWDHTPLLLCGARIG